MSDLKVDTRESLNRVGEVAQKEFQIETNLLKMEEAWNNVFFDLADYKDTNTYVLRGVDELNQIIDEQITLVQAMLFSAFKGPFAERIDEFNGKLGLLADVLEEWLNLQRSWLYLQPIFDSEDINKQLPTEGKGSVMLIRPG